MKLENLAKEISSAFVIGIGESTHGTHEFFTAKANVFIELVKNHGFNTLMLEDRDKECRNINTYIKTGEGNLKSLMKKLYPVWNIKEIQKLIEWMKNNYVDYPVEFVGFDIDQTKENTSKRDELMAKNIIKFKKQKTNMKSIVWAHNAHIKTFSEAAGSKPMGMFLRKELGKNYLAIAQFFGIGEFSATPIDKNSPKPKHRPLKAVRIKDIASNLLEFKLDKLDSKPYYLNKKKITEEQLNQVYLVRSIGWGLVINQIGKYVESCNLAKDFDGLIYYPISHKSNPL